MIRAMGSLMQHGMQIVGVIVSAGVAIALSQSASAQPKVDSEQAQHEQAQRANLLRSDAIAPDDLDLDPELIDESPVLQRWLHQVPDLESDIRNDPNLPPRLRVGSVQLPDGDQFGIMLAIEDLGIPETRLTLNADYRISLDSDDAETYGASLRYYALPLGHHLNFAPVVGYRSIQVTSGDRLSEGLEIGFHAHAALSRSGAASVAVQQTWTDPGTDTEVGTTTLTAAYAVTSHLRVAIDLQQQNSRVSQEDSVGFILEWKLP